LTTLITIQQTTDDFGVDEFSKWSYDEPRIEATDIPRFEFTVPNQSGIPAHSLFVGKTIRIKRLGETQFTGVVESCDLPKGKEAATMAVIRGVHEGYHKLRRNICSSYDFDEDGDPATTRDAVTINPWFPFIFREPASTLDVYSNGYPVHFFTVDTMMQAFAGLKFAYQIDFQDNSHFLASDIYTTTNKMQVYRDGPTGDRRFCLQRTRKNGSGFTGVTTEKIESIPLMNGDPYIRRMGNISVVDVVLVGTRNGTDNPVMDVCRDAGDASGAGLVNNVTRTYTAVSLTHVANYNGSGMSAWTGSVNIGADAASEKAMLGFRIGIPGTDGSASTTKVYYGAFLATTVSDTDLTAGTITAYSAPTLDGTRGSERNAAEGDFHGLNRLEAVERLRLTTDAAIVDNPSAKWDAYVDGNLAFHFVQRRGSNVNREYSFGAGNLVSVHPTFYGGDIYYQVIALGPGSGIAQTRIVNKTAFSSGGLYDTALDPTPQGTGTSQYAPIARLGYFTDSEESSIVALARKAHSAMALHRAPTETYRIEVLNEALRFFGTGDSIRVVEVVTRANGYLRVVSLSRSGDGADREKLSITIGEKAPTIHDTVSTGASRTDRLTVSGKSQPAALGLAGNGVYFDKDFLGVYPLDLPDPERTAKVFLKFATRPWMTTSKTADFTGITSGSGGGTTVTSAGGGGSTVTSASGGSSSPTSAATAPGNTDNRVVSTGTNRSFGSDNTATISVGSSMNSGATWTTVTLTTLEGAWLTGNIESNTDNSGLRLRLEVRAEPLSVYEIVGDFPIDNIDDNEIASYSVFIPSAYLLALGYTGMSGARVTVFNVGGASASVTINNSGAAPVSGMVEIPTHLHAHAATHTHTVTIGSHTHDVTIGSHTHDVTIGNHTHTFGATQIPLKFGPYFFAGDSVATPTAANSPKYGPFNLSVDPADANGDGIPSTAEFDAKKHPNTFGLYSASQEGEIEITGLLNTEANEQFTPSHKIVLRGVGDSGNDNVGGLCVVDIRHRIVYREDPE
jgi:hypothetical protein